jgi:TonB family protein
MIGGMEITVRGFEPIAPAFRPSETSERAGAELKVFTCMGSWIKSSTPLHRPFNAAAQKHKFFTARAVQGGVEILSQSPDLELHTGSSAVKLASGQSRKFSTLELRELTLKHSQYSWYFVSTVTPEIPAVSLKRLSIVEEQERKTLVRALQSTSGIIAAILLLSWIMPAPKVTPEAELIPPQVAKIIFNQAKKSAQAAAAAQAAPASEQKVTQNKVVEKTAVAQAFRAKALQNAVSNLMKGGMTTLLAKSDWVAGGKAGSVLDRGSLGAMGSEKGTATGQGRAVEVASLGGTGAPGSVGYASGARAGVKGQGGAFVDLDMGGGTVQEGLTKDEVGKVIHAHLSEIRYCYESAMIRNPDVEGKLLVDFTIGGQGIVKVSSVKQSTLGDPSLDDCILRRLNKWAFPKPKGGVDVSVTYPFIFKTLGR